MEPDFPASPRVCRRSARSPRLVTKGLPWVTKAVPWLRRRKSQRHRFWLGTIFSFAASIRSAV